MDRGWLRKGMWAASGLFWFLWIGYEDQGLTLVLLLGAMLSLAMGLEWFHRRRGKDDEMQRKRWTGFTLLGAVLGGAAPLLAIVLALVKISLHHHPIPDFSAPALLRLLELVPIWLIAGALLGAAAGLLVDQQEAGQP